MDLAWEIYCDQLFFIHHAYGVVVHSFVLMGNHFHLIASFPNSNFSDAMRWFLGTTSRIISFERGTENHVYGERVFRSRLGSFHYYMNAYKYVYQNPLRAYCVASVEDYRYSTLPGLMGAERLVIPVQEDTILFDDPNRTLEWLNRLPSDENLAAIRKALRRSDFKLPRMRTSLRAHALETELL
jgi:putative transposase